MNKGSVQISVCFVCLGNICRSPTAEGVFCGLAKGVGLSLRVDSAGTAAYHAGEGVDRRSQAAAKKRGYELSSIARQFTKEDFSRFDYVLAMDVENLVNLKKLGGAATESSCHLALLRDFDSSAGSHASVPDPYYGGEGGFEEVLDQCERACQGLLEHLRSEFSGALS